MEHLKFYYPSAKRRVTKKAHVGVVGSGDMEVLMQPSETGSAHVSVQTSVNGFTQSWKAVMDQGLLGLPVQVHQELEFPVLSSWP